jgi:hypothetical protein
MNPEEKKLLENLRTEVKEITKTLEKLQLCASVMKGVVEKESGVNIDNLISEEMSKSD